LRPERGNLAQSQQRSVLDLSPLQIHHERYAANFQNCDEYAVESPNHVWRRLRQIEIGDVDPERYLVPVGSLKAVDVQLVRLEAQLSA
jgi:hypothetical protein